MIVHDKRLLGATGDIWGLSELAKQRITFIPGAPTSLSVGLVAALVGGILTIAVLKKKRIL